MNDNTKILFVIGITFIIAIVLGFSVGLRYQGIRAFRNGQAVNSMMGRRFGMMGSRMHSGGFGMNRGGLSGQVVAVSGNQVSIKLFDGRTEKVTISSSTTYSKTSTVNQADLQTGQNIMVLGQPVSDGSITAQVIKIGAQ